MVRRYRIRVALECHLRRVLGSLVEVALEFGLSCLPTGCLEKRSGFRSWNRWYARTIPRAEQLYEIYLKERAAEEGSQ